jgi:hypothetical protein
MLKRVLSTLARTDPLRWYLPDKLMRMQLVQYAIDQLGARTYLEIGVDEGQSFCAIKAPVKLGVDPVKPRPAVASEMTRPGVTYFQQTSDEFFAHSAPTALAAGIDVAFIDGLHTYGQTFRDITHALTHLNPGGVILVHDCLPASAEEARVADTYDEAWRLNGPSWSGLWTGDGWKAIVAVRSGHAPGQGFVMHCDHGVGVVYKSRQPAPLALSARDIEGLEYEALAADPHRFLGLSKPNRLRSVISRLRAERRPS